MKLYDYFRSSASFRVRIALNLKGLPYETIPVHLVKNGGEQHSKEYYKINPQQLLPALDDNNHILTQSLAIIEYLEETHPDPSLLPSDPYHKALARSFALMIAAEVHPLNNLRVLKYLTDELKISESEKNRWYQHWISLGLTALEEQLARHQLSGRFCFANTPSIADICLVPQLYNARRFDCSLSAYPMLVNIDKNCQAHPAFENAWPKEVVS